MTIQDKESLKQTRIMAVATCNEIQKQIKTAEYNIERLRDRLKAYSSVIVDIDDKIFDDEKGR